MRLLLSIIALLFIFACSSTKQKTMKTAEDGKKEMMAESAKRAAEPASDAQNALLEKYYAISEMKAETGDFVPDMKEMFTGAVMESAEELGEAKVTELTMEFDRVVTPQNAFASFKTHFSKNYNGVYLAETIAWLESPVGKRMTAMEAFADSPEGEKAMMAYVQTLKENPPDSVRLEKVVKLFEENGVKEQIKNMMLGMMSSSERIVNLSLPVESRMTAEQIREANAGVSQVVNLQTEMVTFMLAAFVYKDATDADLEALLAFYETEAGKWHANTEINAFTGMVNESFANVYRALYANK